MKEKKEHIEYRDTCWCKPILKVYKGDNYWLHKDEKGETALKIIQKYEKVSIQ